MNTNQKLVNFLNKNGGMTIQFTNNKNGTVTVCWQQTMDPNEELNDETYTTEQARTEWKKYRSQGYKIATGWHACKRDWTAND